MRSYTIWVISFFGALFFLQLTACAQYGVTNIQRHGSRFGDNLLGYCKAKWVAFQRNMPFYLTPFPYCNELILSQDEEICSAQTSKKYKNKIHIQTKPIQWQKNHNTF